MTNIRPPSGDHHCIELLRNYYMLSIRLENENLLSEKVFQDSTVNFYADIHHPRASYNERTLSYPVEGKICTKGSSRMDETLQHGSGSMHAS